MKLSPKNQRKPSYFKLSCYRDILLNRGLTWKSFSLRQWNAKVFARLNQKPFFAIRTREEIRAIDFELRADRPCRLTRAVRLYRTYCTNVSRGTLPPNRVVGRSHSPLAPRTKEFCRELRTYNQTWIISDEKDQTFVPPYFLTKYGNIYLRPGAWKVKICSIFRLINQLDIFSLLVVEETSFPSASVNLQTF